MERKIILEIDSKLVDGDILVFKGGKVISKEIHELLPELKKIKKLENEVEELKQTVVNLAKIVKEK